eukprot:TRINITY_DN7771_c0_g2_i1.p1 TRINITY_DN7771_c0_g2~~TRINITY_DN7771_c0_g2_i1.p1  ORF type:complete len:127 (+),score=29.16 TRINITY_DN7771_c0_g2_i1:69-449(+)
MTRAPNQSVIASFGNPERRSALIKMASKPMPDAAAPAIETKGSGNPAAITPPPSAAPMALPRLKAPMFIDDARLGASAAALITRTWSGGTSAKLAMPHKKISTAVGQIGRAVQQECRDRSRMPSSA